MKPRCGTMARSPLLDQMNVPLHHAVTDITGYTGLAILDAIIAGERNPEALARLRDSRCKKSEAEIAKALRGDWREEHLFTLRQSLEAWRFHQNLMAASFIRAIGHQLARMEVNPRARIRATR